MEASKPQDIQKHALQPKDRDITMGILNTKHDDIRTARKGPIEPPSRANRDIYV